jgi:hypothetical protein
MESTIATGKLTTGIYVDPCFWQEKNSDKMQKHSKNEFIRKEI